MVSEANTPENRLAAYRVLLKHAEKVAERQYALQLAEHLRRGLKKSTFKWHPTPVLIRLQKMARQVIGTKRALPLPKNTPPGKLVPIRYGPVRYGITPKEVMSYIAHDYDFQKERFG